MYKQTFKIAFNDDGRIRTIELTDSDEAFRAFDDMIKCGLQQVKMFQTCYVETDITELAMLPHKEQEWTMGDAMEKAGVETK